jgi:hypothetical protein
MNQQILECDKVVNQYLHWLKDNYSLKNIQGACEITTPFLDRHNDCIQIYVEKDGDGFILTDDGYTLEDLKSSGLKLSTEKRKNTLHTIINGYGIHLDAKDRLVVRATAESLAYKKHNLIQSILSVNDMFIMAEEHVLQLFKEDVAAYLSDNDIRYTPAFRLIGKTGFDHTFDFSIPKSRKKPERIIKAINNLTKDETSSCIFAFRDVLEVREEAFIPYIIANDINRKLSEDSIIAMKNYGIECVPWSDREKAIEELVA